MPLQPVQQEAQAELEQLIQVQVHVAVVKGFAPSSALMIRMRNLSMTMMTRWPMRALIAKQFQKADAITLKDY